MSDLDKIIWFCAMCTLVIAMIWGTQAAEKHDTESPYHWWSYACCSQKDCGPAEEGVVEVTNEGYKVTLPDGKVTILKWDDKRIKKKPVDNPYAFDGRHHVCTFYSAYGNEWYLRCLYPALGAY